MFGLAKVVNGSEKSWYELDHKNQLVPIINNANRAAVIYVFRSRVGFFVTVDMFSMIYDARVIRSQNNSAERAIYSRRVDLERL